MPRTPPQHKKGADDSQQDQRPDAWERFERAVDAAVKGGPKHRPPKSPAAKKATPKKTKG